MNTLLFPGPDASEETTLLPGEGPRAWGVPVFFLCAFSSCQVGIPRTAEIPGCPLAGAPPPSAQSQAFPRITEQKAHLFSKKGR